MLSEIEDQSQDLGMKEVTSCSQNQEAAPLYSKDTISCKINTCVQTKYKHMTNVLLKRGDCVDVVNDIELCSENECSVSIQQICEELQKKGFECLNCLISYYSSQEKLFIFAGKFPFIHDLLISENEVERSNEKLSITLKFHMPHSSSLNNENRMHSNQKLSIAPYYASLSSLTEDYALNEELKSYKRFKIYINILFSKMIF